jgi:hypothetical protein
MSLGQVGGQKATSIVLRPEVSISADMLFLEYRSRNGAMPMATCFAAVCATAATLSDVRTKVV